MHLAVDAMEGLRLEHVAHCEQWPQLVVVPVRVGVRVGAGVGVRVRIRVKVRVRASGPSWSSYLGT